MLSSTTGGITQQQTTSQKKRISSSITGSLGSVGASIGSEEQKSKETVQKYVIQSNFKELYEIRKKDLVVSDHANLQPNIDAIAVEDADTEFLLQEGSPEIKTISRGELIELDATLESSDIYEYFQVFDVFEDIVESFSTEKEFQKQLREQGILTDEIAMILELMETLMAGLVPIECKLSNYGVCGDEQNVIVSKEWASENGFETEDLYLAGFIDEENLWQEPSRVLFNESEFTVYARLDSPVPNKDWSPLKLVDVLSSVFPDAAQEVENLPSVFEESNTSEPVENDFEGAVREYLETLEEQADGNFPDESINDVIDRLGHPIVADSNEKKEEILQDAEEVIDDEILDKDIAKYVDNIPRKRSDFIESRSNESTTMSELSTPSEDTDQIFLETNFVAIYW